MKQIIDNYKNSVKAIIKNLTGNPNEDLEQEVFVRVWKNLGKYDETGKFRQWISTITSNICKDYLKSAYNRYSSLFSPDDETENLPDNRCDLSEVFEQKMRRNKVAKAILKLPQKLQEAIVLYEIDGLDYQEIADRLKCPLGTVKSRIYKARQALYDKLQDVL